MTYNYTQRIEQDEETFKHEFDYLHGELKNLECCRVVYCHKSGRETEVQSDKTYREACRFALGRSMDGRYKNYTFYVYSNYKRS